MSYPERIFAKVSVRSTQSGFSLVELIMVIVITGILGGIVAVFLKAPIQQYTDVARRAELTDIADAALYRLASDISTAVPNSLRTLGCSPNCVEFLPTTNGGRYRVDAMGGTGGCGLAGDDLDFTVADSCFEIIGPPLTFAAGDQIVLGSVQSDGNPPYDTGAASGVLRAYAGTAGVQTIVQITATQFPFFASLPSRRFDVVDGAQQAITYACEGVGTDAGGTGTGQLKRYWKYGFVANAQPVPPIALAGVQSAILADKVSACNISYGANNQRLGLLTVQLTLSVSGESVSLYHEIHVNNIP